MANDILSQIGDEARKGSFHEELPTIDSQAFFQVIETRRSIRQFTQDSIPAAQMAKIIDAGLKAPNSSNLQSWEFYWVKTPEKKSALGKACLGQPAATTAQELVVAVARTKTWKIRSTEMIEVLKKNQAPQAALKYYEKIVPLMYNNGPFGVLGPFKKMLFFCRGIFQPTPRGPASEHDMKVWAIKSCALACENMMLAARALGFDSCPMEGFDGSRVRKILNLPADAEIVMVLGFGKRGPGGLYGRQVRTAQNNVVFEV